MDINKLKDIKLFCPDENQEYNPPNKMTDSNGNKIYAYVTLVMIGDRYISAALVMAQSLIDLNSQADRVVLITPDVSQEGRELLAKFFDKVIEVNYVTVQNWRTKKQTHRKYLELVFTKFHLFNLTQYKKILLIDADAIVLKHPDHIFALEAPAGCFLEDKDLFIYYDEKGDYKMPPETGIEWYNKYCKLLPHGGKVPKEFTDRVFTDYKNSGIGGGLMLLEPKVGEFDEILKDVSRGRMRFLLENKFVWPEQQYLTARYSGRWTSINPVFFGLQGYPDWSVLFGLQYGGDKPFMLDSKFDINTRIQYRDYQLFHAYYQRILKNNPSFENSKSLQECNKMTKYFKINNELKRTELQHISKDLIAKMYNIDKKYISDNNIDFYHTQSNRFYIPQNIKPLFDNIDEYDYMEPIKRLAEKTKSKYYENLVKNYNIPTTKTRLDDMNKMNPVDKDEIMVQYIKCRPNSFIISLWNLVTPIVNEVIDFLGKHGNVYYVKKIKVDSENLLNLFCQIYDEFTYSEIYERMKKKIEWSELSPNEDNYITIVVFDNVNNKKLSGQGSEFKKEIRNFCLEELKKRDLVTSNIRGNDLLHINDHFYQAVEYAGLYFNENSLELLKNFNAKNYFSNFFIQSHLKFNTLRKWMYLNMSLENINRVCLMGSINLYKYGIRNIGDIDGLFIGNPDEVQEQELIESINTNFYDKNTKFNFADFGIKNTKYWRDTWEEKNKKLLGYFDIESFDDIVYNPKYHVNFHGVKMYLIDFEIVKKIHKIDFEGNYDEVLKRGYKLVAKTYLDFIMMYFYNRNLLGHYCYMTKDNKFRINDDFKIKPIVLNNMSNELKDNFINALLFSLKNFTKEESNKINKELIMSLFK
jgi:hypothetical protein